MLVNRMKTDALYIDIMQNAVEFANGEIGLGEFISYHSLLFNWFRRFDVRDCCILYLIIAERLNELVVNSKEVSMCMHEREKVLREDILDLVSIIEMS